MPAKSAPKRTFGRYEILSLLGKGGMAEVYRARVLSGPREGWQVAIKRLMPDLSGDPALVEQFASEADVCRLLHHPNIVQVLEVGVLDEVWFIELELVDGRDLGQILRRCHKRQIYLPVDFAVYLGRVLFGALAYAHEAAGPDGRPLEIVHCDISPSNLFISRLGEIKLGDFGVAKTRFSPQLDATVQGKPYYLSPEALDGRIDRGLDLWAANVTLYELLTLGRPFTGESPDAVFAAIRAGRFAPPSSVRPEISPALDAIVARGFARKESQRFASAQAFADALEPHFDALIGNELAIAAVVRGLFDVARAGDE